MDKDYRLAICSDLHLGGSGTGSWHNRLLFDRAKEVAESTVTLLNDLAPDAVLILGDVSNDGTKEQLELARSILGELKTNWMIIPGNHDRAGIRSGVFPAVFAGHVPGLMGEMAGIPCVFLPELLPETEYPKTELGGLLIDEAAEEINRIDPTELLVFSHFPLLSQEDYARRRIANYAKHFLDGDKLLNRLKEIVPGKIICFAGHQHWHHIVVAGMVVHCTTASLIECPMEARLVTIDSKNINISTVASACREIAESSLGTQVWVSGAESDRSIDVVRSYRGDMKL